MRDRWLCAGRSSQGIDYSFHMLSAKSSEEDARRQFQTYKVTTYVKGDTAWVVGEWRGGHTVRVGPARLTIAVGGERKCFPEFVINVPRETELVKIETGGGGVEATGVTGRVEIGERGRKAASG